MYVFFHVPGEKTTSAKLKIMEALFSRDQVRAQFKFHLLYGEMIFSL